VDPSQYVIDHAIAWFVEALERGKFQAADRAAVIAFAVAEAKERADA
jgi:hypothetical protein